MRKVIQLCISGNIVLALCDDGSVWKLDGGPEDYQWTRLADIPMGE